MAKSVAPDGMKITRKGNEFTVSWKIPSGGYGDGQAIQFKDSRTKKWKKLKTIKPTTKSASKKWKADDYHPKKDKKFLQSVSFRVRGNRSEYKKKEKGKTVKVNPSVSDWTSKTYNISAPKQPSASVSVGDVWPSSTFSWGVDDAGSSSSTWFTRIEYWTVLLKDSSITDGKKITNWDKNFSGSNIVINGSTKSGTKYSDVSSNDSGSITIKEDSGLLADGSSYTRWFRVCSQGPGGNSSYSYAKHVYASSNACTISDKSTVTPNSNVLGYTARIWFSSPKTAQRPIDTIKVEYAIASPDSGMECPDNVSWKEGATVYATDKSSGATFNIDQLLSKDQCLFVRANSIYDNKTTYGTPKILDIGELSSPSGLTVTTDSETHRATISATNNSSVPDSFLVVRYMTNDDPDGIDIAIIPHGESQVTGVQCPAWTSNPRFGVYAVAPANCYTIDSGYDVDFTSSYSYGTVTVLEDQFYEAVSRFPGEYSFVYDDDAGFTTSIEASFNVEENVSFDENTFYDKVSGSYGTYNFSYASNTGYEIDLQSSYLEDSISINNATFYSAVSGVFDLYLFYYEQNIWYLEDDPVELSNYGISLNSVPVEGDQIVVDLINVGSWFISSTEVNLEEYGIVLYNVPENGDTISITLTKEGSWIFNDNPVKLYDYGIVSSATPQDSDWIIVELSLLEDRVIKYNISPKMKSDLVTSGGNIPISPDPVVLAQTDILGTIKVSWTWAWDEADSAELSWADHDDAWMSTDEPSTYTITKIRASSWNISGLDSGSKWYVRVRLIKTIGDSQTFGAYSEIKEIDLSSPPAVPILNLSESVITSTGQLTASWEYESTDGTSQSFAELAEVIEENNEKRYEPLPISIETAQNAVISAEQLKWSSGENHTLVVRVVSASGQESEGWSNEVTVYIAEPITCEIIQTSFETETIYSEDDEGNTTSYNVYSLKEMPFTVTVKGAGETGTTVLYIERADTYHVGRPDETQYNGFKGETVAALSQTGEDQIEISLDDLIGNLDDGASYNLVATVQDSIGQVDKDEVEFEVHWSHQATIPTVSVEIDEENAIAILKPIAPAAEDDILEYNDKTEFPETGSEGKIYIANDTGILYIWSDSEYVENTDVCDIYRLSVDKPELIIEGATFGQTYVDPYPTIGEYGGHRFVTRTINGDYIVGDSPDGSFAWTDTKELENDIFETHSNIIDFNGGKVFLLYEVDLSNSWDKDFKETKYLGGSVQGDWNSGYHRTGSMNVTTVSDMDQDTIQAMRKLAVHSGPCHVRTKDGSSYTADVQVKETYEYTNGPRFNKYDLSITRIDQEEYDGILYSEWLEIHDEESE